MSIRKFGWCAGTILFLLDATPAGFQDKPLMRLTLGLALLLLAGFWITNLALYFVHMSLDPTSVIAYYRGNETEFMPPRSAQSMLEVTHMHLPMFALVLLLLTHLLLFAPMRPAVKTAFIVVSFGSALLSEAAGWLTRFWHPDFALLKVAAFLTFQGSLAFLILSLAGFLAFGRVHSGRIGEAGSGIQIDQRAGQYPGATPSEEACQPDRESSSPAPS